MPEGDTIHRIARVLGRELVGREIDQLRLHDRGDIAELAGTRVEKIEARGKHMLVHFAAPWVLRVHLGMNGHWRRLHVRQKATGTPTVRIEAGEAAYVCEQAYRAELKDHPRNGWSLLGLKQALAGMGAETAAVDAEFAASWARADTWIRSSRF